MFFIYHEPLFAEVVFILEFTNSTVNALSASSLTVTLCIEEMYNELWEILQGNCTLWYAGKYAMFLQSWNTYILYYLFFIVNLFFLHKFSLYGI